mmetsp:Transcript_52656/g.104562  ORF Transcript_52656/g.104562 Transcript_52656/m.104562 type:complete len:213 (+) Transcript_52656:1388-2026(+)
MLAGTTDPSNVAATLSLGNVVFWQRHERRLLALKPNEYKAVQHTNHGYINSILVGNMRMKCPLFLALAVLLGSKAVQYLIHLVQAQTAISCGCQACSPFIGQTLPRRWIPTRETGETCTWSIGCQVWAAFSQLAPVEKEGSALAHPVAACFVISGSGCCRNETRLGRHRRMVIAKVSLHSLRSRPLAASRWATVGARRRAVVFGCGTRLVRL